MGVGLAVITDAGADERIRWDEGVALREDPAGRGGQRPGQRAGCCPATSRPTGGTHGLRSSSQRGTGGHGEEVGVAGAEVEVPAVGGGRVGAQQSSLPLSGTSHLWAMS